MENPDPRPTIEQLAAAHGISVDTARDIVRRAEVRRLAPYGLNEHFVDPAAFTKALEWYKRQRNRG